MQELFAKYRKAIITSAGVIVFLIAGMVTMIFTDSGNEASTQNHNLRNETANQNSQSQNKIPVEESKPQNQNASSRTAYVYITGEIAKPGVYKLSEDSRIFQLVEMAGGFTSKAETEFLNLAENIVDGSHIHVGAKASPQSPLIPGMPANARANIQPQYTNMPGISAATYPQSSSGRVNVNTANSSELESIPGIGPAIAQRIIDYRNQHGNFARPEDLINVRGIGKSKLSQILPHVTAMNTGGNYSAGTRVTHPQSQSSSSSGLIDINRASQKELERLPGVGPATAKRIIDYRNQHGRFTKPEDLMNIRGIGAAKLNNMRSQIVVR